MTLVSEAMERQVVTVPLEATVAEAAELARRAGVEHLLVLDGEALAGVVCAGDLDGADPGEIVAECMTLPVLAVRPDAELEDAATTMDDCGVGCLPVMVGGLVLGVIEERCLARAGRAARPGRRRPAKH